MTEIRNAPNALDRRDGCFWSLIGLSLLAAVAVHVFLFKSGLYAISADENGRTLLAHRVATGGRVTVGNWLPFYTLVVGIALKIYYNLFLVPRILSFLFGTLSLVSLIWFAHELFGRRDITILTGVLGALLPQRVILSLVPLSEIMFMFMILAGCGFLVRWLNTRIKKLILFAAFFFALSGAVRYEGWVFIACFALWLFFYRRKRKEALPSTVVLPAFSLLLFFPVLWLALHYFFSGNPVSFTERSLDSETLRGIKTTLSTPYLFNNLLKANVLFHFFSQNGATLNLIGLAPLVFLLQADERVRSVTWLAGGSLLLMSVVWFCVLLMPGGTFRLPPSNSWRFAAVWSLLLVPFTAWAIGFLKQRLLLIHRAAGLLIFYPVLLLLLFLFAVQIQHKRGESSFPASDRQAGEFLKDRIEKNPGLMILIENSDWSYLNILVASNYPDHFILNSGPNPRTPAPPVLTLSEGAPNEALRRIHAGCFVFRDERAKDFLAAESQVALTGRFGPWSIFERTCGQNEHPSR
ncbi:MAG TPA: hypothetical protein PK843_05730 [bacterium]|nr:hypothetical protein [bacterium]HPN33992.1 hypothetical protein [bacterium]